MENLKKKQGVALLMALVILATLSILLVNSFEKSALEVKQIAFQEDHFQLNTMVHDILKIFIAGIKRFGSNVVYQKLQSINVVPDFPLYISPDSNIVVLNPKIWAMDHFIFINSNAYSNNTGLHALLKQFVENNSTADNQNILEFIGTLKDYIDQDNLNTAVLNGKELFNLSTGVLSKNSPISFLQELKAIQEFSELNIVEQNDFTKLPFQTYNPTNDTGCILAPLNVNMLPQGEENFNQVFDQYTQFLSTPNIQTSKCSLTLYNYYKKYAPKFKEAIFKSEARTESRPTCTTEFNLVGTPDITADGVKKLFKCHSNLVGIYFELELNQVKISVTAHLKIELGNDGLPKEIDIVYFKIR